MLTIKVKASQITNLTDARYFAAMGVDWLGFSLDPAATNHIPPKQMQEMVAWLEGPAIVGEFSMATVQTIRESYEILNLDFVQLGHFHTVETAKALNGIPIIKEIVVESIEAIADLYQQVTELLPYTSIFLLDLSKNSLTIDNESKPLQYLKLICNAFPTIIQVNTKVALMDKLLTDIEPLGISVVGGEEEAVGVKSFDELDELFDILMIEE